MKEQLKYLIDLLITKDVEIKHLKNKIDDHLKEIDYLQKQLTPVESTLVGLDLTRKEYI